MLSHVPCLNVIPQSASFSGQSPFSAATSKQKLLRTNQRHFRRFQTKARGVPLQHNVQEQSNRAAVASRGSDPFVAAGSRLQTLLSGIG